LLVRYLDDIHTPPPIVWPNVTILPALLARTLPRASPASRRILAESASISIVAPGRVAFRQGHPIPLTLVLHGHLAFRRTTEDGRELVLGIGTPGMMFGFSSVAGSQAEVDLVAVTPAEIATWSGVAVRTLVLADAGLALDIIEGMARYKVCITDRIDGFVHQDARRRVVRILGAYRDLFFGREPILTRSHLPGLVGTSPEMTRRVVRELEREGIVERVGRRGLRLKSRERLDHAMDRDRSDARLVPEESA
jgi:CRP-like cAMP-binding protein